LTWFCTILHFYEVLEILVRNFGVYYRVIKYLTVSDNCYTYCTVSFQPFVVASITTNPDPAATYATDLLTPVLCCHLANATDSELWPVMCCHLANDNDLLTPVVWVMAGDNKQLDFDPPTRLPELTQNWIRSSHGHSTPSLKNSRKSVQPFSRNVADKETNKQRNKSLDYNTPSPYWGRGKYILILSTEALMFNV